MSGRERAEGHVNSGRAGLITDPETIDRKNPGYQAIFKQRLEALARIRQNPESLPLIKEYYRDRPWEFISDWGITFEPRNADIGQPTYIPFVLFQRQIEWVQWVLEQWKERKPGLCEKSRDMGVTWLAASLACTLCLFRKGVVVGFGSRKQEYVDEIGTMKAILPKVRIFMEHLPEEFRGGWVSERDAPFMRINFPETGSYITGEAGDSIGRGDRTSIYFVDEAAHLQRPRLIEASLSNTTNCRIDLSSVNGMNNPFAEKRWSLPSEQVFIFDWRDDPRKDDEWYARQIRDYDPVVVAQEVDRDYSASVEGIVIPGAWVRAAIGARNKLGLATSAIQRMALDVADEGVDKNTACIAQGFEIIHTEEWSGRGGDLFQTSEKAFAIADEWELPEFRYDADGLGAGVRGDARIINDRRHAEGRPMIRVVGFRGSEAVVRPDDLVEGTKGYGRDKGRTNKDYFLNRKAQSWWSLRGRFQKVYRWIVDGIPSPPDEIISIDENCPGLWELCAELSQPTFQVNGVGKIVIDKKPDGMKSPNRADAAMIAFALMEPPPMLITQEHLRKAATMGRYGPLAGRSVFPMRRRW